MFFPGVRRAFHVPHAVVPTLLAMIAVLTGVTAWAIASRSNAGIEPPAHPLPDIASIRSVAYTLPGHDFDDLVVRPADDSAAPRVIATFPNSGATGYHIHGASSPLGESIAVVSLAPFTARSGASLSIVSSNGSVTRQIEGVFDYFTRIAWAPDGSRLAAVRYHEADGARMSSVVEIEPATGQVRTVAELPLASPWKGNMVMRSAVKSTSAEP